MAGILTLQVHASNKEVLSEKAQNKPELNEQFTDMGLGMFVHWSLDSGLGSVISHTMVGASDEYIDRYVTELPQYFNPTEYDPEKWAKLAKFAGFKYMVLTTKHHSGFCLWPTKTTDFSVANTPYKKDIVKQFVDACRKYGLKVGFYFSPEDFLFMHKQGHLVRRKSPNANTSTNPALLEHAKKQIKELFTNYGKIDVAFVDAFEKNPTSEYIHELQPDCVISRGGMFTPEQSIPHKPFPSPWEACFTLGTQWNFKPTNENYKSGSKLIEMFIDIRAKGGNLLINTGPEPTGVLPFEQERAFRELALWMFVNRESVQNIRQCPVYKEGDIWFTRSKDEPSTVYAIVSQGEKRWRRGKRRDFIIRALEGSEATQISVLGQNSKVVEYRPHVNPESRVQQTAEGLQISVVRAQRLYNNHSWPNPIVVKLENVKFVEQDEK